MLQSAQSTKINLAQALELHAAWSNNPSYQGTFGLQSLQAQLERVLKILAAQNVRIRSQNGDTVAQKLQRTIDILNQEKKNLIGGISTKQGDKEFLHKLATDSVTNIVVLDKKIASLLPYNPALTPDQVMYKPVKP